MVSEHTVEVVLLGEHSWDGGSSVTFTKKRNGIYVEFLKVKDLNNVLKSNIVHRSTKRMSKVRANRLYKHCKSLGYVLNDKIKSPQQVIDDKIKATLARIA